jgi:hypothetical protein
MVESSRKPCIGGVTRTAVRPKLTFMGIILGVAGITIGRQAGKISARVALSTYQLEMSTSQWEFG